MLPKSHGIALGWPLIPGQPVTLPPVDTAAPTVTGTAQVGSTLTCSNGTWSNSPIGYSYQWHWADTGAVISGATSSTYVLGSGDVGHTIDCIVTATNSGGGVAAQSNVTAPVASSGGGGSSPSLDFSDPNNSQYVPLLAA